MPIKTKTSKHKSNFSIKKADQFLDTHKEQILKIFKGFQLIEFWLKIEICKKNSTDGESFSVNFDQLHDKNLGYTIKKLKKNYPEFKKLYKQLEILRKQRNSFMHIVCIVFMTITEEQISNQMDCRMLDSFEKNIDSVLVNFPLKD